MVLTFDVFSKRNKLYKITGGITIITVLCISTLALFDHSPQTHSALIIEIPIDVLIVTCVFVSIFFVVAVLGGYVKSYIKDGELVFSDDYIIIDNLKILLNEMQDLSLKVSEPIKRRMGTINNRITVTDANGKVYKNRFAIKSYNDNKELDTMLRQWHAKGVAFKWSYTFF
jgi:hypothetical protein